MSDKRALLFRCEASREAGIGHWMRCLALAQAWQDSGGECHFAMSATLPEVDARIRKEGLAVHRIGVLPGTHEDARQTGLLAERFGAEWVVVDGYGFGPDFQQAFREQHLRVLVIDDHGQIGRYAADAVVDPNLLADPSMYGRREPGSRLLLGPDYILLRREFTAWRGAPGEKKAPMLRRLLLTMGGSDPDDLSYRVLKEISRAAGPALEITTVIGAHYARPAERLFLSMPAGSGNTVVRNVGSMPDIMSEADCAVIAAGGTLWELMFMECPVLSFFRGAVQETIVGKLDKQGAVLNLGPADGLEESGFTETLRCLQSRPERLAAMREAGRKLVDGRGAEKIVAAMREMSGHER